jgi:predicted ATP-grasp superfamily ATP-dependent carboligase
MRKPASVIIGDHTQGLGILRSAAVTGGDVWVVNDKGMSLTRFSKYLSHYRQIGRGTLGHLGRPEFSEVLLKALLELPVEYPSLLFGVNEDITRFIYQHAQILKCKYFIPAVRLDRIYDKYLFNLLLPESARIDTRLCSETEIGSVDRSNRFILKGRQGNAFRQLTGEKAIRLDRFTEHHRGRLFRQLSPEQVIIQEIVETDRPVSSVCSFSINGQMSGIFAYEKLRQHPNVFGTGTYLRSIRADSVEELADCLLKSLDYTGISEIEFIYDCRTGTYRVIEMNPRTWKSINFASQCGQNLVAQYLTYVATGQANRDDQYACDQDWVDLATDIPQMIRELNLRRYQRGFFECTWDRLDPWPAVALWTLFPLIALENGVSSIVALARSRESTTLSR